MPTPHFTGKGGESMKKQVALVFRHCPKIEGDSLQERLQLTVLEIIGRGGRVTKVESTCFGFSVWFNAKREIKLGLEAYSVE